MMFEKESAFFLDLEIRKINVTLCLPMVMLINLLWPLIFTGRCLWNLMPGGLFSSGGISIRPTPVVTRSLSLA